MTLMLSVNLIFAVCKDVEELGCCSRLSTAILVRAASASSVAATLSSSLREQRQSNEIQGPVIAYARPETKMELDLV